MRTNILAFLCLLVSVAPVAADVAFDRSELALGKDMRQTVVPGFFLGGAVADLAVVKIASSGDRHLQIFGLTDGRWTSRLDTTLRREVTFVDVVHLDGRDRLVAYGDGKLTWFDPESSDERPLAEVRSSFVPSRWNEVPHVDVTRDVNGDGRDDLVVPVKDGFRIFVRTDDGFADPVSVGPPPDLRRILGPGGYRYDPWSVSRVWAVDADGDGRDDLVYWTGQRFAFHRQDEHGSFEAEARSFATEVSFDTDRLDALADNHMRGRVLYALDDLNDDGVADLVVHELGGKRDHKSGSFEAHFGRREAEGGLAFASKAGLVFEADDRVYLELERHDFDGDGRLDLMLTSIERRFLSPGLWKRIKGFMGDDIGFKLEFYRNRNGSYAKVPDTVRGKGLDGAPSHREPGWVPPDIVLRGGKHERRKVEKMWPRAFNPTFLIGDVTGDGRAELLIEHTFRGLDVYAGVAGPQLFATEGRPIQVIVPADEEYNRLVDLNRDGKLDLLLHDPFTERTVHGGRVQPPGSEPHRVRVLIAR